MKQTMIVGFEGVGSLLISLLLAVHFLIATMLYIMGIMKYIIVRHILFKFWLFFNKFCHEIGVGGAVMFLVVGTISKEERPQQGQLWMEQYLISLKYWPI